MHIIISLIILFFLNSYVYCEDIALIEKIDEVSKIFSTKIGADGKFALDNTYSVKINEEKLYGGLGVKFFGEVKSRNGDNIVVEVTYQIGVGKSMRIDKDTYDFPIDMKEGTMTVVVKYGEKKIISGIESSLNDKRSSHSISLILNK